MENQGNLQLSRDIQCSTRAAPLSGEEREEHKVQQHLADWCVPAILRTREGSFARLARAHHGHRSCREGRVVAREQGGHRDALAQRAGAGAALPPSFAD